VRRCVRVRVQKLSSCQFKRVAGWCNFGFALQPLCLFCRLSLTSLASLSLSVSCQFPWRGSGPRAPSALAPCTRTASTASPPPRATPQGANPATQCRWSTGPTCSLTRYARQVAMWALWAGAPLTSRPATIAACDPHATLGFYSGAETPFRYRQIVFILLRCLQDAKTITSSPAGRHRPVPVLHPREKTIPARILF
jgi:hypothetical protein